MTRERLDFLGALLWHVARLVAALILIVGLWRIDQRGQAHDAAMLERHERFLRQHETFMSNQATMLRDHDQVQQRHDAFMQEHNRMMRDHDASTNEHRAILQRLAR